METPPFTAAFEASLKENIQGGTMTTLKGRIVDPQFVCCLSGAVVGVDKDPVARLIVAPTEACVGDNITANPCNSYHPQDPAFVITDYQIEWGDGAGTGWLAFGGCVAHNYAYAAAGVYTVSLSVRDDHGITLFGAATVQVLITECPADGGDWEEGAYAAGLYASCGASGVWFSEDGGLNYVSRGLDGILIRDLKVNQFSLASVYLGFDVLGNPFVVNADVIELWAASENGLYKSVNGGLSWSLISTLPVPPELEAVGSARFHVRAIKPSTVDQNEIYLAVDAIAAGESFVWVYRTINGGDTWTTLRIGPPGWEVMAAGLNGRARTVFIDTDGIPLVGCTTCFIATGCEAANRAIQFTGGAWAAFGVGIDVTVWKYLRTPAGVLWACGEMDDQCGTRATGVVRMVGGNWTDVPGHGFAHADSFSQSALNMFWDTVRNRLWVVGDSDTAWAIVEYYDGVGWTLTPGGGIGDAGGTGEGWAIVTDAQGNAYVGGNFEFANGGALTVNNIAYYDLVTGWETLGTDAIGANDAVRALALDADGRWLYIGGTFTHFGGVAVNRFCRYNTGTGEIEVLGTNLNGTVYAVTILPDGRIFVAGAFTTDGDGNAAGRTAIYDPLAQEWSPMGTGMNDLIRGTDVDPDTNIPYAAGDFTTADGNVVNYVSRYVTGQATLPAEGRTHIIDMDINGQNVYLGLLDTSGNPFIAQIAYDLTGFSIIYEPGAGTWGGVLADLHFPNRVWLFGDFGAPKLLRYVVNSGEVIDTTDTDFWTGTDMIRPLLQSPILMRDLVAIENIAAGVARAWASGNTGTDWVDLGVVDDHGGAFEAQCGARDFIGPANVLIGASTVPAASHHLRWSPNGGYDFLERSSGIIPTTAPITSIIVVA